MSPDSAPLAAELGARMASFVTKPVEDFAPLIESYRALFLQHHPGRKPPAPMMIDFTYCHEDAEEAERVAREYLTKYYLSLDEHYELSGSHFGQVKGYEQYASDAELLQQAGEDASVQGFIASQIWGTPEQIIEKQRHRLDVAGDVVALFGISYAGMPYDTVRGSFELLGSKVVPALKKMGPAR
jgi:alkanesulfonate monooxygenase SsuD/methylene tetrahydromethanopterin reductase-like flavin-dependent oxidoreductase (luciferase family)